MEKELPKRKKLRLIEYDYSNNGYYFITICTKGKICVLCRGEQCSPENPKQFILTNIGKIVETSIINITKYYQNLEIVKYVIMPNHIHLIIISNKNGRTLFAPTTS